MSFESDYFKKRRVDFEKLLSYGFTKDGVYRLSKEFLNGAFRVEISVDGRGEVSGKVYESDFDEEYTAFRVKDRTGAFVGSVRAAYAEILEDIAKNCFTEEYFTGAQANRIAGKLKEEFGEAPDFPWDDLPASGVFRNPENRKWYALIMNIDGAKLGLEHGEIDALNVKLDEKKIPELIKNEGYFPAYHMNKKYWITLALNETLPDCEVMERLKESRAFTLNKK